MDGRSRQSLSGAFGGLEQFGARGEAGGIGYCIAGAEPYRLEFTNSDDVICLLLGDIFSDTRFEDDRPGELVFSGETAAFHPAGGNVRVAAHEVRRGFVAFSFPKAFQEQVDDSDLAPLRRSGSCNNIRTGAIRALARYARAMTAGAQPPDPLQLQLLGSLIYVETLKQIGGRTRSAAQRLSDAQFSVLCDYVSNHLDRGITCAQMASAVDLPLRTVFDGMKQRTGLSPYRFVIERRVGRAQDLLAGSDLSLAEIALACGFASQQHLTTTLARMLGITPGRLRARVRSARQRAD